VAIVERIRAFAPELVALRRDIHAHPELGFEERRTSDLVATALESFGCKVERGLAETGVIGVLKCGSSQRSVGLRADLDALPMQEANQFAHRSRHEGRMHACGHDGHTAMLLGAARYLAETRNFDGTVHFIFQPAEEGLGGAARMVAEGLFEKFPCDAVFGMHNHPGMAVGKFAFGAMAGAAGFEIAVKGVGSHGAQPERGVDPILVASHIVTALQSIVARNVAPLDAAVISVAQIEAGHAFNVIPDSATMRGTARAFSDRTMSLLQANMRRVVENVAAGLGASAEIAFGVKALPLVSDPAQRRFAGDVLAGLVGEENIVRDGFAIMASEDFAFMLRARPGAFIQIGNGEGEGGCDVHNPNYDFNDAILPLGASAWVRLVEAKLAT
jgi:amidohydrolase